MKAHDLYSTAMGITAAAIITAADGPGHRRYANQGSQYDGEDMARHGERLSKKSDTERLHGHEFQYA